MKNRIKMIETAFSYFILLYLTPFVLDELAFFVYIKGKKRITPKDEILFMLESLFNPFFYKKLDKNFEEMFGKVVG
jgi:hypothetical protein